MPMILPPCVDKSLVCYQHGLEPQPTKYKAAILQQGSGMFFIESFLKCALRESGCRIGYEATKMN